MSCKEVGGCSRGGCSGCSKSTGLNGFETSISSIVELEIHYSETGGKEAEPYVFESLYCLTNIQTREARVTGLEGKTFQNLDEMRQWIMDCLLKADDFSCCSLKSIDVSYVKADV